MDGCISAAHAGVAKVHRSSLQPLFTPRGRVASWPDRGSPRTLRLLGRARLCDRRITTFIPWQRLFHWAGARKARCLLRHIAFHAVSPSDRIRTGARTCALQASSHSAAPVRQSPCHPARIRAAGMVGRADLVPGGPRCHLALQCDAPTAFPAGLAGLYLGCCSDRRRLVPPSRVRGRCVRGEAQQCQRSCGRAGQAVSRQRKHPNAGSHLFGVPRLTSAPRRTHRPRRAR